MAGKHRPTLRDRLEFGAFRLVRLVVRILPEAAADALGSALGWFVGSVLRVRRDVVDENLALAFPESSPAERGALAAASYGHLGREAVATLRTAWESGAGIRSRTEVHGLEAVRTAVSEGPGAILVTGHLGNWELGGAALAARGLPLDAVAFRQRNRLFDRDLVESRRRLGMEVVRVGNAPREVIRSVRRGRVPALVADQNVRRGGVFVDFLGVPASTARGPAVFSLRTGARLFVVAVLRDGRGSPARYQVHMEEVAVEPTGDVEEDVRRLTAAHTAVLEGWVRRAPEQYFWVHKRWKTRPPGEGEGS